MRKEELPKHLGQYEILRKIGDGMTAQVYLAKNKQGQKVSMKIIDDKFYKSKTGFNLIQNQVTILKDLSHKNILHFISKIEVSNKTCIITEYCEGGNLQDYLVKNKVIKQKQALKIIRSIVQGCIYLNDKNIVHRDLKLSNIFMKQNIAIIADFGFAVHKSNDKLMGINAGSPLYMPLQSLKNKKFSEKSDVFAVGVCLYELLTGITPWNAQNENELQEKLIKPPTFPKSINNNVQKLLLRCLLADVKTRPNFQQLYNCVTDIINEKEKESGQINKKQTNIIMTSSNNRKQNKVSISNKVKAISKYQYNKMPMDLIIDTKYDTKYGKYTHNNKVLKQNSALNISYGNHSRHSQLTATSLLFQGHYWPR